MNFQELIKNPNIIKAVEDKKYTTPTRVQEKAIPAILNGKDILGCAHTGSGKTGAFAMPILQMVAAFTSSNESNQGIQALILAPTRELAIQIGASFDSYGKHLDTRIGVIYGGITPKQHIKVMKRDPQILIATPGRLLDLIEKGHANLSHIKTFVLDEADQMLDLKTLADVKKIISLMPPKRQNMLFSATMPKEVMKIVNSILNDPLKIDDHSDSPKGASINQLVHFVEEPDKATFILELMTSKSYEHVLIFTRTKKKADLVCKALNIKNIRSKSIHSDKNQSERLKALELFKNKEIRVLVATDVAARGIHIDNISHVINMDIPNVPETYIHRIGRTGRAGVQGTSISLCSQDEKPFLAAIEQLQKQSLEII